MNIYYDMQNIYCIGLRTIKASIYSQMRRNPGWQHPDQSSKREDPGLKKRSCVEKRGAVLISLRWRFCLVTRGPQGSRLMSRATAKPTRKKCTLSWWSEDGLPQGEDMERFRLIFFHKKCYRFIPCSYKCTFSSQIKSQQHFTFWEQWCSMSS